MRKKTHSKTVRMTAFGNRQVIIHGRPNHILGDLYHHSITARWSIFFAAFGLAFVALNIMFGVLYALDADGIANLYPQNLLGTFFFSVETFATVGYGDMHPISVYTHLIATIEMFVGTANAALLTGLIFARFSMPRARIVFANHPVMTELDGRPTLMIRTANARHNFIVDASAKLSVLEVKTSSEGLRMRRLHDLKLMRDHQPMFFLGWTIMHVIDEESPLYGLTADDFQQKDMSFVLILQGLDESTAQQMQARQVYSHSDVLWQHRYVDAIYVDEQGASHIDYDLFHDTEVTLK